MAGIASDRAGAIQVAPIAAVGAGNPAPPAVTDFMDAFRSGFITVDDINRRNRANISDSDTLKTQLQVNDFQRRLAPGQFENAQASQALQADQIAAARQTLPGALDITLADQTAKQQAQRHEAAASSDDEETRLAEAEFRALREYEQLHGHAAPKSIKIPAVNPEPVKPFEEWFSETQGAEIEKEVNKFDAGDKDAETKDAKIVALVNKFQSGFPLNSEGDKVARAAYENKLRADAAAAPAPDALRAQYSNQLYSQRQNDPAIRKEYQQYVTETENKTDVLKPGSPEYLQEIQQRNQIAQEKLAVRAAKVKALPGVIEARAKAEAEAPVKTAEAKAKAQGDVLTELHKSEALKRFEPQFEAFEKVDQIRNSGRAPNNSDDIATLYEFVKLLDPTSAVREGEAKLAQSTVPAVRAIYNKAGALFKDQNKFFDDQTRASLYGTMDSLRKGAEQSVVPEIKRIAGIALDRGVPLDQVFTGPYQALVTSRNAATSGAAPPSAGATTVVQNGVTFRWNGSKYVAVQ